MRFVLRMAARETRASWRRLLFFFVCIAVGVAAIVTLRSVIQNVRVVVNAEARALVGADVVLSTNRDWPEDARKHIDQDLAAAGASARTETLETPTMVRPVDSRKPFAKMGQLRAVQSGYPLYGDITLQGPGKYSHALLEGHGTLVRPEMLTALQVAVGDQIRVGTTTFTIRGVIAREPGGQSGFALGPRFYVDYADVPSTQLLGFGSRADRLMFVRVPDARVDDLMTALRRDVRQEFINVRSFRSREDQVGRDFDRAEDYLSLVGLVIVILGGIAVSSVTRVFILQKIRSIAVLKCVGARSAQIVAVYVLQVLALGFAGSLLGIVMARGAIAAIPLALKTSQASILTEAHYGVTWSAALQGVAIGILVSLLFSVVPLLQVRFIKPSLLLRDEAVRRRRDGLGIAALVVVSLALVAVTAWQASSLRVGFVVTAGFGGLALVLTLAAKGLVALVAPLASSPSFPLRHAVLHLSRPGNQTRVVLLAVGLGAFFIVGIRSLEASLLDEFSIQTGSDSPDMFLLDIQRGQADAMRAFLRDPARGTGYFQLIPVLRARVAGVTGREQNLSTVDDIRQKAPMLQREFTLTYRDHLESNERVLSGSFWNSPAPDPEVSIEREIADRAHLHVGDTIRFDILGRRLDARVTSIRSVEWRESRNGGFVFVFRPGPLDQAPQTYVSPLKGPDDAAVRGLFQHDLAEKFPNVTVIDFRDVLQRLREVMAKVTLAITIVGGLVLFSGVLILIGAVAMTKFQRVYEAAVFKTLGANTRTIGRMLLYEYGVLGSLAGLIGSVGAVGLTWGVSKYALEIPWRLFPAEHVAGVVATAILVAAIGVLSSLDVLRHKPLATLRAE